MLRHLDLFSGIGGFALAAQMVGGIKTVQFCEIDKYAQRVLAKNFPNIPIHDDITTFAATAGQYDLITGGFPCQDISSANGNGRGLEGKRSGLFYELIRIVCECRPHYVVLENVSAMLSKYEGRIMGTILWELSQSGYDAEWQVVSASSVGAPHLRERVFIVAYPKRKLGHKRSSEQRGCPSSQEIDRRWYSVLQGRSLYDNGGASPQEPASMERARQSRAPEKSRGVQWTESGWKSEPPVGRVANGIPNRVDRLRGLGNAIVPDCGAIALQRVLELENAR